MINQKKMSLLTDLYELTMAQVYWEEEMLETATFSLFIREYPSSRSYFVSAGLNDVLDYLSELEFSQEDLGYLESTGLFKKSFLSYLEKFKFRGEVYALPEGRLFFAQEPLLEVTAPLIEAQVVETFLINTLNLQVSIATKASRCFYAAGPRKLVDFSLRRTQGADAGMKVVRASYIGGFKGTSNVLAGKIYGIPIVGTMAHSFVCSFESELEAFRAFARTYPQNTVLLVDTYDTISGIRNAVKLGKEMAREGVRVRGIRLDSGDIAKLSQKARKILQEEGLGDTLIFASGGFDEYKIADVLSRGGEVDSFGVGTKMGVSADAPYMDMAYKLVKYAGRPVLKLSPGKSNLASDKQIFRFTSPQRELREDIIGLRDDKLEGGEPLLEKVMEKGVVIKPSPQLSQIQNIFLDEFSCLPTKYKRLEKKGEKFPVKLSPRLKKLQSQMIHKIRRRELGES